MNIPLSEKEKIRILNTEDLYTIMQQVLLREHKMEERLGQLLGQVEHSNKDQKYFWVVGLDEEYRLLFIELISLGLTPKVKPMDVFSLALQRRAAHLILCHNRPTGDLRPSSKDKDITDRLIQVGNIVNTPVLDHQIINSEHCLSFKESNLMTELRQSLKYVPSFEVEKRIREEAEEIIALTKENVKARMKAIQEQLQTEKNRTVSTVQKLRGRGMTEAEIVEITGLNLEQLGEIG